MAAKTTKVRIAVLFIIGTIALAILATSQLKLNPQGRRYYIYFDESVAGLFLKGKVKFKGADKGYVKRVELQTHRIQGVDSTTGDEVREEAPMDSPKIEVMIVISEEEKAEDQVPITNTTRAYLRSNPLSGLKFIDLDDEGYTRGARIQNPPEGEADLWRGTFEEGAVDLTTWWTVKVNNRVHGIVNALRFTGPGKLAVRVRVPGGLERKGLTLADWKAWFETSADGTRAYLYLTSRDRPSPGQPAELGPVPESDDEYQVLVDAATAGFDPVVHRPFGEQIGRELDLDLRVVSIEQRAVESASGALTRGLAVEVQGKLAMKGSERADLPPRYWLLFRLDPVDGKHFLEARAVLPGADLPEGSIIPAVPNPLSVLLEKAEALSQVVEVLPSMARNLDETIASANAITAEFREGTLGGLNDTVRSLGDKLIESVEDLRGTLTTGIENLQETTTGAIQRTSDTINTKLEQIAPERTIRELREGITRFNRAVESARITFGRANRILGDREGSSTIGSVVQTVQSISEKVKDLVDTNAADFGTFMEKLSNLIQSIGDLVQELRNK